MAESFDVPPNKDFVGYDPDIEVNRLSLVARTELVTARDSALTTLNDISAPLSREMIIEGASFAVLAILAAGSPDEYSALFTGLALLDAGILTRSAIQYFNLKDKVRRVNQHFSDMVWAGLPQNRKKELQSKRMIK